MNYDYTLIIDSKEEKFCSYREMCRYCDLNKYYDIEKDHIDHDKMTEYYRATNQ